jgi:hypothetical protein
MNILKFLRRARADKNLPTVVVFAGGMGTQIFQAAAYFSLKSAGHPVYADLSYFDTEAKIAETGKAGQLTHWFWQLDQFGLPKSSFDRAPAYNKHNADILRDGPRMAELALKALAQAEIRAHFKDVGNVRDTLAEDVLSSFLCIHIRRGDYVNVASHLISDEEFISLIRKFSGLINNAVILSDSPIGPDFRNTISPFFKTTLFLDNIDSYASHRIMRAARILICSNSTFSLTAAALNPNALVFIPKKWVEGKNRLIDEAPLHSRCLFQILENS